MQASSVIGQIVLGERRFTLGDQLDFARFSGDWNPIHTDPVYARRCLTGQAVVHGMNMVLWALELLAGHYTECRILISLRVQFIKPAFLNERLICRLINARDKSFLVEVIGSVGQAVVIELVFSAGSRTLPMCSFVASKGLSRDPVLLRAEDLEGRSGEWEVATEEGLAKHLFPACVALWGEAIPIIFAHISRLVGMECPGRYALFSELELAVCENDSVMVTNCLRYQVVKFDKRFKLVTSKVNVAGYSGSVRAFLSPPPVQQARMSDVKNDISSKVFTSQRALVIGGSRGLGELAAKMLAAGGADVYLTYNQGQSEANDVVLDILSQGGNARAIALDVREPIDKQWKSLKGWAPTHLYYFATPYIFSGQRVGFSPELLTTLISYYVTGFARAVETFVPSGLSAALYPSTVALDEFPTDMTEYCAAKAAGEALCQLLVRRHRGLNIICPRLPRLATDQTVSLLPAENHDPRGIIRDLLLKFSV